ncbi:MAG: CsgG/HfaB family protein [bacterium JZ-2024 1]
MKRLWCSVMLGIILFGWIYATGPEEKKETPKKPEEKKEQPLCPERLKKTLAVTRLEPKAPGSSEEVGDVLTDMLETSLVQTGCFIVVERKYLYDILQEQKLVAEGKVTPEGAAKAGKLLGAQIVLQGAITRYSPKESGGAIGGLGKVLGGVAGYVSKVSIDLRLVDTTTGEIISAFSEVGEASAVGVAGGGPIGDVPVGGAAWHKTPIAKAAKEAIDKIVKKIAEEMKKLPWQAKVSLVKEDKIYLNAGKNGGIQVDDVFFVYSVGEAITDPDTGAVLGFEQTKMARIQVTEVQDKFSIARVQELLLPDAEIKKGDIVKEK